MRRVTIRRSEESAYDIRYAGVRIGSAHNSDNGPGWYVRSEDPPIALRNTWSEGLRYETPRQAAQAAAAYARAALKRARPA